MITFNMDSYTVHAPHWGMIGNIIENKTAIVPNRKAMYIRNSEIGREGATVYKIAKISRADGTIKLHDCGSIYGGEYMQDGGRNAQTFALDWFAWFFSEVTL